MPPSPDVLPGALRALRHGLVVSCQAPIDSPLHDPSVIAALAQASLRWGAAGVRLDTPEHIRAVRERVSAPIIGQWKEKVPGFEVYITPQFRHAEAVAAAGADIIAIDGTQRERPGGRTVSSLIEQIHQRLGKPVMADVDTLAAAIAAQIAGADCVGTTLHGRTAQTSTEASPALDLIARMAERLGIPAICEGGLDTPELAREALSRGAYAVVVGRAITGIDMRLKQYRAAIAALHPG